MRKKYNLIFLHHYPILAARIKVRISEGEFRVSSACRDRSDFGGGENGRSSVFFFLFFSGERIESRKDVDDKLTRV